MGALFRTSGGGVGSYEVGEGRRVVARLPRDGDLAEEILSVAREHGSTPDRYGRSEPCGGRASRTTIRTAGPTRS